MLRFLLLLLTIFFFIPAYSQTLQSVTDGGGNVSARNAENIIFKNTVTGQTNYLRWYEADNTARGYIGYASLDNRWFYIDNSQNNPVRIAPRLIVGLNTDDGVSRFQVENSVKIYGNDANVLFTNGKAWDISSTGNHLSFNETGVQTSLFFKEGGNVGIGTSNPQSKLQIGNFSSNNANKISIPGVYNFETVNIGQYGNGSSCVEFVNHANTTTSFAAKMGTDIDTYGGGFFITMAPVANSYNTLQYGATPAVFVNLGNEVGIGTRNTAGYQLAVGGNMIAEKVKVKLESGWPDYVFEETYVLPTLQEVEAFIKRSKHLPGIPSSEEVKANGLDLGDTDKQLLKKIEELTLYLIDQDKKITSQQELILQQQKLLQALEKRLNEIR